MDTIIPTELWEWPLLAAVIVVVGWLLYQMRDQMRQAKEERKEQMIVSREEREKNTKFIQEMVQKSDAERSNFIDSLKQIITANLQAQQAMTYAIEKHAADVDRSFAELCKDTEKRHAELMKRIDVITGAK
jgi:mevalonate kinase